MCVIGIDQSYTSTGYTVIDKNSLLEFGTIKTRKSDDTDVFERAYKVTNQIIEIVNKYKPERIGIEGLAFAKFGNATRDLAGLQWVIVTRLRYELGFTNTKLVIVPPNQLKKTATDSGSASKDDMVKALPSDVYQRISDANYKKTTGLYDITDAYWIAQYALKQPG